MYILSTKLKNLKNKLKVWNIQVFGNVHSLVTEAESKLLDIQNQIQLIGHYDLLMIEEKNAQATLDDALNK